MSTLYRARISDTSRTRGYFQCPSNNAYNFGTGDFTVMAMVTSTAGGTVISRSIYDAPPNANAGFWLQFWTMELAGDVITFGISDDAGNWMIASTSTTISVCDGQCHSIAGVRRNSRLHILLDGIEIDTISSFNPGAPAQININNNLPMTIGFIPGSGNQLVGSLMNAGVWNAALSGQALERAMFGRVRSTDANLQGYWTLSKSTADLSVNNNPVTITGAVSYEQCLGCMWATGENQYAFCEMTNSPGTEVAEDDAGNVAMSRSLVVASGTPVLCASLLGGSNAPTFPVGATLAVVDPTGKVYNQNVNSSMEFITTKSGQPWVMMIRNPTAGSWKFSLLVPSGISCSLYIQTLPTQEIVTSIQAALQPLFGHDAPNTPDAPAGFGDRLSWDAVAAVAGAIIIPLGALKIGIPAAVLFGTAYFAVLTAKLARDAILSLNRHNLNITGWQLAGMTGFIVSPEKILLSDPDVSADLATQLVYKRRYKRLYSAVNASTFAKSQIQLVRGNVTRVNVASRLASFRSGYVSMSGHGLGSYLTGWYVSGNEGALQEVLTTGQYDPSEVAGKIVHLFACRCGSSATSGLGRNLVSSGAVAFFGYSNTFAMPANEYITFCDCDITIDLELLFGKTCGHAYTAAITAYNTAIRRYRSDGKTAVAALLQRNRDLLVAPSTNAMYGSSDARLDIGVSSFDQSEDAYDVQPPDELSFHDPTSENEGSFS